jgi:hypothetical protein
MIASLVRMNRSARDNVVVVTMVVVVVDAAVVTVVTVEVVVDATVVAAGAAGVEVEVGAMEVVALATVVAAAGAAVVAAGAIVAAASAVACPVVSGPAQAAITNSAKRTTPHLPIDTIWQYCPLRRTDQALSSRSTRFPALSVQETPTQGHLQDMGTTQNTAAIYVRVDRRPPSPLSPARKP